jgi:hypothetical protein
MSPGKSRPWREVKNLLVFEIAEPVSEAGTVCFCVYKACRDNYEDKQELIW